MNFMLKLSQIFQNSINNIGLGETEELRPVFYNSPVSIRFEIGANEDDSINIDSDYVSQAFFKAKEIYENLPSKPTILRIDAYEDDIKALESAFDALNLPQPHDISDSSFTDEDNCIIHRCSFYWDLELFDLDYEKLLYEVIKSELGGMAFLGPVYYIDTSNDVLFYLYDDRGADVSAVKAETLRSLYERFNKYILDYDREQIDKIFKS